MGRNGSFHVEVLHDITRYKQHFSLYDISVDINIISLLALICTLRQSNRGDSETVGRYVTGMIQL